MDLICYGCMVGFHEECNAAKPIDSLDGYYKCCCWANQSDAKAVAGGFGVTKREPKDASEVRDQTSTGRKRAVVAISEWGRGKDGTLCEWAYLRSAGGGAIPIVGCNGTIIREVKQTEEVGENESPRHIHHGPDKSTLNNSPENLHAICASCHTRWHALNDPAYAKDRPDHGRPHIPLSGDAIPHDPETKSSELEQKFNNQFWSLTPAQRKTVPYREMLEGITDGRHSIPAAGSDNGVPESI